MLKYIITWAVVSMQPTSCPDANKASEFGIKSNPYMMCAVYHARTVEDEHSKAFTSRDSAQAFYNRLKAYKPSGFSPLGDKIERLSLDSLKIK